MKCPSCGNVILMVNLQGIDVNASGGKRWHGSAYSCPSCQTVLSVQIDPIALKNDIIAEMSKLLKRPGY